VKELEELYKKRVKEVMDDRIWDLPLLPRDADIPSVLSVLTSRSHVWIVESKDSKKIAGVITEHDIRGVLAPKKLPRYVFGKKFGLSLRYGTVQKAEDIMCKNLITCSPDETVEEALNKMIVGEVRRLPVVDDGNIIGEITLHHLLQFLLGKR